MVTLYVDATSSFPEHLWSLPLQQARFPDFRLERVASGLPSLNQTSDPHWKLRNRRYTVAGTVWAFHPSSLVALYGAPATVQLDNELD